MTYSQVLDWNSKTNPTLKLWICGSYFLLEFNLYCKLFGNRTVTLLALARYCAATVNAVSALCERARDSTMSLPK